MNDKSFSQNMLRLASRSGVSQAFSLFLDTAISMNSGIEDIRQSLVYAYHKPERYLFMETWYSLYAESVMNGSQRRDVLGDFYNKFVCSEYCFAPQFVYDMLPGLFNAETVNMRIADFYCRSGRRLMAAASYNRWLRFYGADPDITMVKMTLLNYYMNELSGEVAMYDARHDQFYGAWNVDLDYKGRPAIKKLPDENSLIFQKRCNRIQDRSKLIFNY